jgi:hypothetical protein
LDVTKLLALALALALALGAGILRASWLQPFSNLLTTSNPLSENTLGTALG